MKKQFLSIILCLSILLLGSGTVLAGNSQSNGAAKAKTENTNVNKADKVQKENRYIQSMAEEFSDIQNDWSREEVLEARAKGFVTGYEDKTFRPNSSVSKLETLVLIINALGLNGEAKDYELSNEEEELLTNIPDWGKNYVALALKNDILTTEELQNFNPQQAAKRYEVCMYMSRVLENEDLIDNLDSAVFTDEDQIPAANKKDVRLMWKNGIISGYPDGKFQPMKAVKRNELITMLNKLDDNCLQIFTDATVKGSVEDIDKIDGGYKITIEKTDGKTVDVETNEDTKILYHGREITTIDIETPLNAKILLDQNGDAVIVRLTDAEDETINDDNEEVLNNTDEASETDAIKTDDSNKPEKHKKQNKNNASQIDDLSLADEVDQL